MISMMLNWLMARLDREEGQGMAEYGLIMALVVVIAAVSLVALGPAIATTLDGVVTSF